MTHLTASEPLARPTTHVPPPVTGRRGDRAFAVFTVATGIGLVHAFDDALVHRQPGVPADQHLLALVVVVAAATLAIAGYRRMRTGVRAAVALAFGGVTLANGLMHVMHVSLGRVSASDVTGVLAAGAGATLVVLSAALPFLHRGERRSGAGRRWAVRVVAVAATGAMAVFVLLPVGVGIGQTHLFRDPIGSAPAGFEEVRFRSSDGLTLSGWYRPSRNGAAVVVVSSAGGDRLGSVAHGELLARHGYGVLLYDARGSGESDGSPNGYGWDWMGDVTGAMDYLQARPDVDAGRIGGLGLSTGADVLIEVAAEDRRLRAVVGDGATGRSLADVPPGEGSMVAYMGPVFATVAVLSGTRPGRPLAELAADAAPTPMLLIAAGSLPQEIAMNAVYADAGESTQLWTLPDVAHTDAIRAEAAAYERRVVGHLDAALLGRDG